MPVRDDKMLDVKIEASHRIDIPHAVISATLANHKRADTSEILVAA